MKITPRDKALLAYGKARGILDGTRKEYVVADVVFGISKQESITSFRKNHPLRRRLVKDAWQKRAICRAWNPVGGKTCSNCKHTGTVVGDPCFSCCFPYQGEPNYWEPRKEGE